LPLLATNGVNYARPHERELADAFTALQHRRTLATAGRLLARNAERYLKSPAPMRALLRIFRRPSPTLWNSLPGWSSR